MRNSLLLWFSFCIALGVLFLAALIIFGVIDVEHKGRVVILVAMALAVIIMNFRNAKK